VSNWRTICPNRSGFRRGVTWDQYSSFWILTGHLRKCECVGIRCRSKTFYGDEMNRGMSAASKGSRPFGRVVPQL
jgi:hypothetical protein